MPATTLLKAIATHPSQEEKNCIYKAVTSLPSVLPPTPPHCFSISASLPVSSLSSRALFTILHRHEQKRTNKQTNKMHTSTSCDCPHVQRHKTDVQITSDLVVQRVVALITSRGKQSAAVSVCFFYACSMHAVETSPIVLHPQRCCRR